LPAEAEVNPVFAGTGIFVIDFLSHDGLELKRGEYVKRKEGANS
jgi:hypothetical protein